MRRWVWWVLLGGLALVVVVVLSGVLLLTVGRNLVWGARPLGMHDRWGWATPWSQCPEGVGPHGPGMMGRRGGQADVCDYYSPRAVPEGQALSLEEAHDAFERYLDNIGYGELEIREVMEFEYNFYAIAEEPDTGMGAMEVLLDKETGSIGPEPGPNMMWNARYGMHGGFGSNMMGWMHGQPAEENALSEGEAWEHAQSWAEGRTGIEVDDHADEFYGYYTFHTLENGEIEGMVSVHGSSGRVWYHSWHGEFIDVLEMTGGH
jgi:hypothetical protein